ncbi:MAG: hypothetical protein RI973_651 [Bacteroidota bacterium]
MPKDAVSLCKGIKLVRRFCLIAAQPILFFKNSVKIKKDALK